MCHPTWDLSNTTVAAPRLYLPYSELMGHNAPRHKKQKQKSPLTRGQGASRDSVRIEFDQFSDGSSFTEPKLGSKRAAISELRP